MNTWRDYSLIKFIHLNFLQFFASSFSFLALFPPITTTKKGGNYSLFSFFLFVIELNTDFEILEKNAFCWNCKLEEKKLCGSREFSHALKSLDSVSLLWRAMKFSAQFEHFLDYIHKWNFIWHTKQRPISDDITFSTFFCLTTNTQQSRTIRWKKVCMDRSHFTFFYFFYFSTRTS